LLALRADLRWPATRASNYGRVLPTILDSGSDPHLGINPFGLDHHHLTYSLHVYLNLISTLFTKGAP
jgi:hypothetical protein